MIDRAKLTAELEQLNRTGDRIEDAGRTEEAAEYRRRAEGIARQLDDDARARIEVHHEGGQ